VDLHLIFRRPILYNESTASDSREATTRRQQERQLGDISADSNGQTISAAAIVDSDRQTALATPSVDSNLQTFSAATTVDSIRQTTWTTALNDSRLDSEWQASKGRLLRERAFLKECPSHEGNDGITSFPSFSFPALPALIFGAG
jgi:hypothetical protein